MGREDEKAMAAYQAHRRLILALVIGSVCLLLVFGGSLQDDLTHELIESHGLALILIGIGGRLWSILYIGGRKSEEVVASGPYSIMRNPLYFFSTIAAIGVGAQTGSYVITFALTLLCMIAFHIVTLREERYLKANLGAPYISYLQRVPRFFPNPRLFRDEAAVTFTPRVFRTTFLDGLVFLLAVPFFEIIEIGQETGFITVLFRVP